MTVKSSVVSVGATATRLSTNSADQKGGASVAVYNAGTTVVYLGGSDVTAVNGFPLTGGNTITVDLDGSVVGASVTGNTLTPATAVDEALYGIVTSGTVNVNVLVTGV